jgi:hypothetical protein
MTFWIFLIGGMICGLLGWASYAFWEDDEDRFD